MLSSFVLKEFVCRIFDKNTTLHEYSGTRKKKSQKALHIHKQKECHIANIIQIPKKKMIGNAECMFVVDCGEGFVCETSVGYLRIRQ